MFWKKKEKPAEPVVEIRYDCRGINYLDVIEVDGENLDSIKEESFEYLENAKKVYTRKDIDSLSQLTGFDVWNGLVWIDINELKNASIEVTLKYRWGGIKEGMNEGLTVDANDAVKGLLNKLEFYTREEIEKVAEKVGFSVFDRSSWKMHTISIYKLKSGQKITCYKPPSD